MFRILHIPTGRYFGNPDRTIENTLYYLKNHGVKSATSSGLGKIWNREKYARIAFDKIQKISNEFKLIEIR